MVVTVAMTANIVVAIIGFRVSGVSRAKGALWTIAMAYRLRITTKDVKVRNRTLHINERRNSNRAQQVFQKLTKQQPSISLIKIQKGVVREHYIKGRYPDSCFIATLG